MRRSLQFLILQAILHQLVPGGEASRDAPSRSNDTTNTANNKPAKIQVTLFYNIRFNGLSQTYKLSPGQCIGLDANMKDEASSFKGTCAIVFDRPGCTGKQRKMEGNVPTMPFGWNNKIESIGSCTGAIQTKSFENILTLYENEHFQGRSSILQPSPALGTCANLQEYQAWASSVKVTGCLRTWTRKNCTGAYLNISEDKEELASVGFENVIRSYELCSNGVQSPIGNTTEVIIYSDTHRRGEQQVIELHPGQCIDFPGFEFGRFDYPKSIDAECAYLYYGKGCTGKRLKVIKFYLNLDEGLIGADSVQSCKPGPVMSNTSYVMLVRNDGLKSPLTHTLEPSQCVNLMFEFEKADLLSYDTDCAILYEGRWCQGANLKIGGIGSLLPSWKNRASSVGSCNGPVQRPPANLTTVTVGNRYEMTYTVEIPPGPCASMTKGRHWGRVDADSISTNGCVYWYNEGSDCTGMRRKVENGTVLISAFAKGRPTWENDYLGSLQTCAKYGSGPSYVAIYEYPQLNVGYNSFVGFRLEPRSCIDLWGSQDKWVASIDADCAVVFDGHWCTEEQRKIVGAVEELGNWKHRISSIGSCDGPITSGRPGNTSLITMYSMTEFEGVEHMYLVKPGECVAFAEYVMNDPRSALTDGCVQLYSERGCRGSFKELDGSIEDFMEWSEDKNKYFSYRPHSARRCK